MNAKINDQQREEYAKSALIGPSEAAKFLGLSAQCLANWRWNNRGPRYYRLGQRSVRYRLSDLEAWREAHGISPEAI